MKENEGFQGIIQDIRDNIGKLIGIDGENIYVIRGTNELVVESVFHNFFKTTSKILLIGRQESLEYIMYICKLCELNYEVIYVNEDVLPLSSIMEELSREHYDAIYIPYYEMNSGVVYNINVLSKSIEKYNLLLIVNIGNNVLMNPIELDKEMVDIVIGNTEIFQSKYSYVGINNKAKSLLVNNYVNYFINYSSYEDYISNTLKWIDEYRELNDTLLTVNELNIMEWYSYFAYLVSFIRTKIKQLGYRVLPDTNYSNAYIVVEVDDANKMCEELYNKYQVLVYAGYKDMNKSRIIIDMKDYMSILGCLKLLRALKEIDLK